MSDPYGGADNLVNVRDTLRRLLVRFYARRVEGHLVDPTNALTGLQQQVYEGRPGQTLQEVVPYPVVYEPIGPAASLQ